MFIRGGTLADVEALVALDEIAEREPARRDYITRTLQAGHAFVAERDGRVVGYGVLTYSFYSCGMIELIYVALDCRREGVGRALVQYGESRCQTAKLFTSTNLFNKPMQMLLASSGYRLSGYIENLDPGDPELVYYKRLKTG